MTTTNETAVNAAILPAVRLDSIIGVVLDWQPNQGEPDGWVATVDDRNTRACAYKALVRAGIVAACSEGCIEDDDAGVLYIWAILEEGGIKVGALDVTASIGTPTACLPDGEGYDFDVDVTVGDVTVSGEVTLVPSADSRHTGLVTWGALDNWASSEIVKLVREHDLSIADLACAVVSACDEAGTSGVAERG